MTSSKVTSADISTIDTDWSAVLSAEGSSSTETYPYMNLVLGQQDFGGPPAPGGGNGGMTGC